MTKVIFILTFFLLLASCSSSPEVQTGYDIVKVSETSYRAKSWNPDAGVIPSLTENARVSSSSNTKNAAAVLDENTQTNWQSDAPFPSGFLNRSDLNLLLNAGKNGKIKSSPIDDITNITDGHEQSSAKVSVENGQAWVQIPFTKTSDLYTVAVRCYELKAPIKIVAIDKNGKSTKVGDYLLFNASKLARFSKPLRNIKAIKLISKQAFGLQEVAALADLPTESVTVDLGAIKTVGWIDTRHWAGLDMAKSTQLLISKDGNNWNKVADLEPGNLNRVTTLVSPAQRARYIKVEHSVNDNDWNKVFVWEIDAYDEYGPYGEMPPAKMNPVSMNDMMGVNGIWGWGYSKSSTEIGPKEGAGYYNQISSHARNYHFLNWDVVDPDDTPDYKQMVSGKGTAAQWWLNWDTEYAEWRKAGISVQTSIKIADFAANRWNDPYKAAYGYGSTFAKHFGRAEGNGLVEYLEVGNEPWAYEADFYLKVLEGMARGVKETDRSIKVLPCALQAAFPQHETEGAFKNYIGARLTENIAPFIDALNVHHYSYIKRNDGIRISVHPEHPYTELRVILNDIRFRDHNLPGMPIFVSEWGWDSDGGGEPCTHSECVSARAQALYAVRGAMLFARLGVSRLTWFFYANEEKESSVFTRSGLTSSPRSGYIPKPSLLAFKAMKHHLGNSHFLKVLQEDDQAWVYMMGDNNGNPTHLVAWRPVSETNKQHTRIQLYTSFQAASAHIIEGSSSIGQKVDTPIYQNGKMALTISAAPLVVRLK